MAARNLEVVRALYHAFARRNLPAALATMAEDIEWNESDRLPWGGTQRGPQAIAEHIFAPSIEAIPDLLVTAEQLIASEDTVAVIHRYTGTGKLTGKRLDIPGVGIWDLRDQKIVRYRQFTDTAQWDEALS